MGVAMQYSRQHVVNMLRNAGFTQAADEASRVLPDPVDFEQVEKFAEQHGIFHDDLINRMGGSPD
jgi:hypothetical protein